MFEDIFADLNKMISTPLGATYHKQTEIEYYIDELNDLISYVDDIASEWNGDQPGRLEDRAVIATDVMEKAQELKNLLKQLEEL